jgi:hypothetical protein
MQESSTHDQAARIDNLSRGKSWSGQTVELPSKCPRHSSGKRVGHTSLFKRTKTYANWRSVRQSVERKRTMMSDRKMLRFLVWCILVLQKHGAHQQSIDECAALFIEIAAKRKMTMQYRLTVDINPNLALHLDEILEEEEE